MIGSLALPVRAQVSPLAGGLDFFLTDESLWALPAAELAEKLQPSGYTTDAKTSAVTLGEPRDMMKRQAHLFTAELAVWKATLTPGATLRSATFDLLPPAALAKTPSKTDFRSMTRRLEEHLSVTMKVPAAPHPSEYNAADGSVKSTCQRWVGKNLQAILITAATETRAAFTPRRIELKVLPAIPPGQPAIAKVPVVKTDRSTGVVVLDEFPALPEWDGSHPDWLVLEQALWAIGKNSDRNGILECYSYGTSWVGSFVTSLQRLVAMSGARAADVSPPVHQGAELIKLGRNCDAAAKKLGKHSPEKVQNLIDIDPDVLRMARSGGNSLAQFGAALKQAIAGGRPLLWYGWHGIYPEIPKADASPGTVVRLIIGYAQKEGEVIFADAAGKPGARMKIADALAASLYTIAINR